MLPNVSRVGVLAANHFQFLDNLRHDLVNAPPDRNRRLQNWRIRVLIDGDDDFVFIPAGWIGPEMPTAM
jgi:hypothetical protein